MISDEILKKELLADKTKLTEKTKVSQKIISPEESKLAKDINESVNVSGILNNCFFHSLALYYLGNNISFPDDLFTMKQIHDNNSSPLQKLYARFKTIESLEIFYQYAHIKQPNSHQYPNHLVEKVIVLGVFIRNWFVEQLRMDEEHCKALFEYRGRKEGIDEKQITFMSLIEKLQSAMVMDVKDPVDIKNIDELDLFSGELDSFFIEEELSPEVDSFKEGVKDNPIYLANKKYFDESLPGLLSDSSKSEKDKKDCFWSYWNESGYLNYCNHLNEKVKISYGDVESVLLKLKIPFNIYSYSDSTIISEHSSERELPAFKLAFDAEEGHYYLFKNEKTVQFLEEYQEQQKEYNEFRSNVLATSDRDKISQSHDSSALFLAATLPSEVSNRPTLELLVERVEEMSRWLLSQEKPEYEYNKESDLIKKSPRSANSNKEAAISSFANRLNSLKVGIQNNSIDEKKENAIQTQTKSCPRKLNETSPRKLNETSPRKLKETSPRKLKETSPRKLNETSPRKLNETSPRKLKETSPRKLNESKNASEPKTSTNRGVGIEKPILIKYSSFYANLESPSKEEFEHFERLLVVEKSLYALSLKVEDYKGKKSNPPPDLTNSELAEYVEKYQNAETAASILSIGLSELLKDYKQNRDGTSEPYEILKSSSLALIKIHRPELAKHRDNDRAITNFIASIFGLGVIYGFVQSMLTGFRYFFLKPEGAEKVDTLKDALEKLPCPES
ncbi:MAG: hypothetical protein H0T84_15135 [Tatlockia sp.]|nr:hypothetical protein [Tatlockia sp.]